MGRRPADLSGRKFGMLTAKYATEKRDKRGSRVYFFMHFPYTNKSGLHHFFGHILIAGRESHNEIVQFATIHIIQSFECLKGTAF